MFDIESRVKKVISLRESRKLTKRIELSMLHDIINTSVARDKFILKVATAEIMKMAGNNCAVPDNIENCCGNCKECICNNLYDKVENAYSEELRRRA